MRKPRDSRKARFEAALKLAGTTAAEWAAVHDVTPGHLSQVLAGKRESKTLIDKVEAFTRAHLNGTVAA